MVPLSVFSIDLLSEHLLLITSVLVFVALLMTKVGTKIGVPTLLVFLVLGMLVGQDGLGLKFENYHYAELLGHFAVAIILLRGGLETSEEEIRPIRKQGLLLSTIGLLLMVLLTGDFIYYLFPGLHATAATVLGSLLVAAIMSSTDATVVFSMLRSKRLHLRENLAPLLELESSINDPTAYVLTVVLVVIIKEVHTLEAAATGSVLGVVMLISLGVLVLQIVVGYLCGYAFGHLGKWIVNKVKLPNPALTSIMILCLAFFGSGISEILGGNGLITIYLTGIIINNKTKLAYTERRDIMNFFDGLSWLVQLLMFLMLGILARPSLFPQVLVPSLLIGLFMMFVSRPLSVFIMLLPFRKMSWRAKAFVSWIGMKGAGPILFALCPIVEGLDIGQEIFSIVFIVTMMSLILQGMTMAPVARLLKLSYDKEPEVQTFGIEMPEDMGMLRDHVISDADLAGGGTVRDLHLPHGIRIVMVRRDGRFLVPHGSMPLQCGDHLILVMGESDD